MSQVQVTLNFSSVDEMTAFFAKDRAALATAAVVTPPAAEEPKKGKPAKEKVDAASTPTATVAKDAAPEKKVDASSAAEPEKKPEPVTYEKSGIPERIAKYMGDPKSEGYATRRDNLLGLINKFEAKVDGKPSAKGLKADQYEAFKVEFDAMAAAPAAEEALG
jgi:hypothetical protein